MGRGGGRVRDIMSTATMEIIRGIEALEPQEKAEVSRFVQGFEERKSAPPTVKYADDDVFQEAKRFVFKRHAALLRKLAE